MKNVLMASYKLDGVVVVKEFEGYATGHGMSEKYLQERGQTLAQAVEQAKNWTTGITKEKFLKDIIGNPVETMTF